MSEINFPYKLDQLHREKAEYYIPADQKDIDEMMIAVGVNSLDDLYSHIQPSDKMSSSTHLIDKADNYQALAQHVLEISKKNVVTNSFIGDGLSFYKPSPIVNDICSIRGLTTAYTPYQPEKSQGTLKTLWVYQSVLKELTGFEAINASLYDRSMGIFEAIKCALRISRSDKKILIIDSLYKGDKEVLKTLSSQTGIEIDYLELNNSAITTDVELNSIDPDQYCAIVFSQTTCLGSLENVDLITDFCRSHELLSIAVIDPILLSNHGLKKPSVYGSEGQGVDIITGEAHNLSIDKNFGGPGLGIFGVRFNETNKAHIRQTPGRFVGQALDEKGQVCQTLILSTREQHIRKDKATSNICSNQSFIASLAAANILHWGDQGLSQKITQARKNCLNTLDKLLTLKGIDLAFDSPFYNEVCLRTDISPKDLIKKAKDENIEIGVCIEHTGSEYLKMFFSDIHSPQDLDQLINFFKKNFNESKINSLEFNDLPENLISRNDVCIASHSESDVIDFYKKLGDLNFSPDDGVYPLGSCTMKYNPYINDFCAGFDGFTKIHPQTDLKFAQGNLEILFEIQEFFKNVTGLKAVTTQPVAGAQGELLGLKLFQAYHQDLGQKREYILIPKSAHGTNPATANVAGYKIKYLEANSLGQIDIDQLKEIVGEDPNNIAGIMITNPNTSGVFEARFKEISDIIHQAGGLVYMDGANMNAIAGHVNLEALGVDAVHNNLHKTWTIPHGGGGPGDAIVAVSAKLEKFLPGFQIIKSGNTFSAKKSEKSIGSFHRHWGNFAHKVRCYTYIKALGSDGVRKMSAMAVLSARYLHSRIKNKFTTLPLGSDETPRMHEFILGLTQEMFKKIEDVGIPKAKIIGRVGKLFLDFGFHAPTVSFPEVYGLMIEPTESFTKSELDEFADALDKIFTTIETCPQILLTTPHFTPVSRIDELSANKKPILSEQKIEGTLFPKLEIPGHSFTKHNDLKSLKFDQIKEKIQASLN